MLMSVPTGTTGEITGRVAHVFVVLRRPACARVGDIHVVGVADRCLIVSAALVTADVSSDFAFSAACASRSFPPIRYSDGHVTLPASGVGV